VKPEEKARQKIDQLLLAAGWQVQDHQDLNLGASLGVAVREFPVSTGYADYMLFVDRKAAGVIEAKPAGTTLTSAEHQSEKYLCSLPPGLPCFQNPLPFAYESTGVETFFRDLKDPSASSRRLFAFHTPETLCAWASDAASLRGRLQRLPPLITDGLRDCQVEAISKLEASLGGCDFAKTCSGVFPRVDNMIPGCTFEKLFQEVFHISLGDLVVSQTK
jgi:type I restriction enzyme, R subunit